MAFIPLLEPGEQLIKQIDAQFSEKSKTFNFAVSDRALYLPATKLLAVSDPFYFQRVAHAQVQDVTIKRLPPYGFWIAATLMVVTGAITIVNMMEPIMKHAPGTYHVTGWPLALIVGGLILPFAAKGRFGLRVTMSDKKFSWKPPMVVDKASKEKVAAVLNEILDACSHAGLRVADDRKK